MRILIQRKILPIAVATGPIVPTTRFKAASLPFGILTYFVNFAPIFLGLNVHADGIEVFPETY